MMDVEVCLPSLGDEDDAVRGGVVSAWLAKEGDVLDAGGDLLELTTDKAAFVVPCPSAGRVSELRVAEGTRIEVGAVLCMLTVKDADA